MKGEMWFKNKKMERNMECDSKTKERIKLLEKELEDLENEDKELIKKWINPFYSQEFKLREKVNLMKTFHEILKSLRHSWPDISFESIILRRCDKNNKFLSINYKDKKYFCQTETFLKIMDDTTENHKLICIYHIPNSDNISTYYTGDLKENIENGSTNSVMHFLINPIYDPHGDNYLTLSQLPQKGQTTFSK